MNLIITVAVLLHWAPSVERKPYGPEWRAEQLSDDEVASVIRTNKGAMKGCYEAFARQGHEVRGRTNLILDITADGAVGRATIELPELAPPRLAECIEGQVRGWRFPPAQTAKHFQFPLLFVGR